MSIKNLVLNKGWAGKTLTRSETAQRMNVLIRKGIELLHHYNAVAADQPESANEDLASAMSMLRADIGKLSESVHSCGAVAYSGVDLDPSAVGAEGGWLAVGEHEEAFERMLAAEKEHEHHMRNRAVIGAVATNSKSRSEMIRSFG